MPKNLTASPLKSSIMDFMITSITAQWPSQTNDKKIAEAPRK
jgi:hypothetical protein